MTTDPGVMRRIKKCLELGTDPRTPAAEAEAAMRQAQKLMTAHGLSEGVLAAQEVGTTQFQAQRSTTVVAWESRLYAQLCRAFGAKLLWRKGDMTVRNDGSPMRARGWYTVVGLKHQLELIQYAATVLSRQILRARADYLEKNCQVHHDYIPLTRAQKAAYGDAFCEAFVAELKKRIHDFALTDLQRDAIQLAYDSMIDKAKPKVDVKIAPVFGAAARAAGAEAARNAHLHRPMNKGADAPQLGGGMMRLLRRVLCTLGIHTQGIRSAGCMYNISVCRWCRRDVLFVLRETTLDR